MEYHVTIKYLNGYCPQLEGTWEAGICLRLRGISDVRWLRKEKLGSQARFTTRAKAEMGSHHGR